MQIDLGIKIRTLRRRDGHTQEALAEALGVTAQAVSRWESGGSYPDMNLIPSIANYFGVTIDELFGYTNDRTYKIEQLVASIREMLRLNRGEDVNINQCIALARAAMIEFPGNEKVMLCLASVLYKAAGVRYGEHRLTDSEGYSIYDTKRHQGYAEWTEAIKLYEKVLPSLPQGELRHKAVDELSQLYVNMGYHEKAMALAESAPDILGTREFLKIYACDGKQQAAAYENALLTFVQATAALMVNTTLACGRNLTNAEKVQSLQGAIGLLDLVCVDGDYGEHERFLANVYMLLSVYLWLVEKHDEAFIALDKALAHAKAQEAACKCKSAKHTSPLLRLVGIRTAMTDHEAHSLTERMAEDWPWWDVPEQAAVRKEMQTDPRWDAWVQGCKS